MRYQVLILICMVLIISLSAMNSEFVTRFGESSTSFRLNNMLIEDGKLYLCKEYGVDIFEIEGSGDLNLLNTIEADDVHNFAIDNNNLYFACRPFSGDTWETTVYKYDVSVPEQPVETGQLQLDYPPYTMYIWHDMLTIVDFLVTRQLLYYDPESLEFIDYEEGTFLKPFYEDYWCTSNPDFLTIYDLSDPFNAEVVTSVDLESVNNGYSKVCRRITDELYVVYSQLEMSFWDTSDFNNWQLLNQFLFPVYEYLFYDMNLEIWDNTVLLPLLEEMLVVDISDPELPQVSQILYPNLVNPTNCKKYGDHIYLVDNNFGIQILDINDDEVQLGEICTEFPKQTSGLRYGDNILREAPYREQGLPDYFIWDISNPESPQISAELDLGSGRSSGKILADMLIIKNEEDLDLEFYDISDLPEVSFMASIDCFENLYEFLYGNFYVFENENDKIYIKIPPDRFVCYDISDPQSPEELFEIMEEEYFLLGKQDDYLYFCDSSSSNEHDLKIYSGIDSNNPQLAAHFQNIFPEYFTIKILGNKLFISHSYDAYTTQVYNLNGAEMPEMICSLYLDFSGRVYYYGGEYIICSIHEANSFFIPENPPEFIEPSSHIGRFNFICNLEVISSGIDDYLYIFDGAYTEIYQVEGMGNDEDLITESIQMIIYPNPFNPLVNISFQAKQQERVKVEIYNIKGQIIDTVFDEQCKAGKNLICWDAGANTSGVYLLRIAGQGWEDDKKITLLK